MEERRKRVEVQLAHAIMELLEGDTSSELGREVAETLNQRLGREVVETPNQKPHKDDKNPQQRQKEL
jgi:hypothetical protein